MTPALRSWLLLWHRWVGLLLALLLVALAATGSVIVWFDELDGWVNPHFHRVESAAERLPILELRARVEAQDPSSSVYYIRLPQRPDQPFSAFVQGRVDPATGDAAQLDYDEVFADPYTGKRLGQRMWGDYSLRNEDLITQLYYFHYALAIPGDLGISVVGWVGVIWALDCLIALGLAFPLLKKSTWRVKWLAGKNRVVFDVHRAGSLWLWVLLLVIALSGFAMSLPDTYEASLARVLSFQDIENRSASVAPLESPPIGWEEGYRLAQVRMAEAASAHGFTVLKPYAFTYRRSKGAYFYRVRSDRDLGEQGKTTIGIDATTGRSLGVEIPTGALSGNTATTWMTSLHMAKVGGWPWRVGMTAVGLLVAILSVTGFMIFVRKWRSRRGTRVSGIPTTTG